jgi:DNA-binding CsgD family transcriptional regulator
LLDRLTTSIVLLDREGRVVFANKAAKVIFRLGDGLRVEGALLRAERERDGLRLDEALRAVGTHPGPVRRALLVHRGSGKEPLQMAIVGLRFRGATPETPATIVLISDPERPLDGSCGWWLAELYGLTSAERFVARELGSGRSPIEIATLAGVKPNTIRMQLKSIYRKTGTCRQAELVRLLLGGPSVKRAALP